MTASESESASASASASESASATSSATEEKEHASRVEFYDEGADDADEEVMARASAGARATDATLSCPGCFTTVSARCQRHVKYATQYRAIFAMNVAVEDASALVRGGGGKRGSDENERERYREVKCASCGVVVGVMDEDEVYHFFNVIPSQG